MFYRKNMGSKERWARVIGGALIVACSLAQIGLTPLGLVLAASGVFTALTGWLVSALLVPWLAASRSKARSDPG